MESYQKDISQLIQSRRSTRKYNDQKVSKEKKELLLKYMKLLDNQYYRFEIVDYNSIAGEKLGTYGMIKNAKTYIVAVGKKSIAANDRIAVDFGYDFEKIILKATDMDLKTCWMGITFNVTRLSERINFQEDENIIMISPIGYSDSKSIVEKMLRGAIKADKRKNFNEVFFNNEFGKMIDEYHHENYKKILELVRLAPSAGNSQPWRVVQVGGGYDFYIDSNKYKNMKNKRIDFAHTDLGIAKIHFEAGANEYGMEGVWKNEAIKKIDDRDYVFSWYMI